MFDRYRAHGGGAAGRSDLSVEIRSDDSLISAQNDQSAVKRNGAGKMNTLKRSLASRVTVPTSKMATAFLRVNQMKSCS